MRRKILTRHFLQLFSLSAVCLSTIPCVTLTAQPPAGTTSTSATATVDTGTILGSPASEAGKANCWISRGTSDAVVVSVFEDPVFGIPVGQLRQYKKTSTGFVSDQTKITLANSTTYSLDVVPIRVEKVEDALGRIKYYDLSYYPNGYEADGIPKAPKIQVGWAKFYRGNSGRSSSDVLIRFHSQVQRASAAVAPCDNPPNDDIGEEEEIDVSAGNVPGESLPLVPATVEP